MGKTPSMRNQLADEDLPVGLEAGEEVKTFPSSRSRRMSGMVQMVQEMWTVR